MSFYEGKIRKLPGVEGKVVQPSPEVEAAIHRVDAAPRGLLSRVPDVCTATLRRVRDFSGTVRLLDMLYRFFAARVATRSGYRAEGATAPAQEIEAYTAAKVETVAPLTTAPAQGMRPGSRPRVAVLARLTAYNIAQAVTLRGARAATRAAALAAPGAVAKGGGKITKTELSAPAITAPSAIAESRFTNRPRTGYAAAGDTAPTVTAEKTEVTAVAGITATATTGTAAVLNASPAPLVAHRAKMATWIDPEVVNGVLILRQVYSATQTDDIVEVV